ncbi:uncharacterized protein [Diabrotica undecimpunctata]|uniref:uncharacterized protein n=1 Tax=Diabrotica undecimpunctata TaxID=50387 RepID=UPI003B63CE22
MDMRTHSRDFILEFISCFRDCSCLWKCTSPEYKNKSNRLTAYVKLLKILKKHEPNSTIADVKRKIQSLRASYRKERNKVTASMRTGSGIEDIYQPKLWYYNELEFLNDQARNTRSQRSTQHNEDNLSQLSMQHSEYNITSPSPSVNSLPDSLPPTPSTSLDPSTLSRKLKDDHTTRMFSLISQRLSEKEDEFDVFGKNVSNKLRTMTTQQQILAQKLINDVIFCGQMEQLSLNSQISVK